MWSDNETSVDYLGYSHLLSGITDLVKDTSLLPSTVGIFGDWGSGKTSLIRMASAKLTEDKKIHVLEFDGWLFEGYDDARCVLMESIVQAVLSHQSASAKVKKLGLKLLRKIDWFRVVKSTAKYGTAFAIGGPAGLALATGKDITEIIPKIKDKLSKTTQEDIKKLLEDETSSAASKQIQEFRSEFKELIESSKFDTLVVVIDDLDRCLPDTIIETLEAIKLFLFVPKTAFIIGADERLVRYAVRRRFPEIPGERAEVGRDYLEKLIQFSIKIPSLSTSEIETYMALLFCEKVLNTEDLAKAVLKAMEHSRLLLGSSFGITHLKELDIEISPILQEQLLLGERISPILASGLSGNPRQCKRFLNTLMIRSKMAESRSVELGQRILAKLMLLEYFRESSFKLLGDLQADQEGKPKEIKVLEKLTIEMPGKHSEIPKMETLEAKDNTDSSELGTIKDWLEDSWLVDWAKMEPSIGDVDLRPYFYFSRDVYSASTTASQRLSPLCQELLGKLLSESVSMQQTGLQKVEALNAAEAGGIFDNLVNAARRSETISEDHSALNVLFRVVDIRRELLIEYTKAISNFPESSIDISVPLKLLNLTKGTSAESMAVELIRDWSKSAETPTLKKSAVITLKRHEERGK